MFKLLSDPYLNAAFWVGSVACLVTVCLSVGIVVLRVRLHADDRRWRRFVEVWRPALLEAILARDTPDLPRLRPGEHVLFLRLWTYLQESLRGEASRRLNEAAGHLGIDAAARGLLLHGSRAEKLQAILAAGYLKDALAWTSLVHLVEGGDSLLAVNAARALVRIDPLRAATGLMPMLVARTDWDLGRVAGFLGEARQAFWLLMARSIPVLRSEELPRALQLAETLRLQLPVPTLARLLQPGQPPGVVRAALRLSNNPELAAQVRHCLTHADPGVRELAARQMAWLAQPADVSRLTSLLDDRHWMVRMAAADAIARLPFLTSRELDDVEHGHPLAAEQLRHVRAELRLA